MRVIIAGSRDVASPFLEVVHAVRDSRIRPTCIVSGTARGIDQAGEKFANDFGIPLERYPADWNKYGKRAGYKRNEQMAEVADALIAVWDGKSRGTKHMIDIMRARGKTVYVRVLNEENDVDNT